MGLGKLLEERARADRERVFLYYQDRKLTIGEIFQRVRSLAAGLFEQGLKPGDRVGIYLPNCPEAVESLLAVIYAGGIAMPLNPQWKSSEIEAMLGNAGARFLILSPAAREEMKRINRQSLAVEQFICIGERPPEGCFAYHSYFLDKEIEAADSGDDQAAVLVHTSGTTGSPKAVMLTHRNLISNFSATAQFLKLNPDDLILGILPLYHVMGMAFALAPVFRAGSVVLAPEFTTGKAMSALRNLKVTVLASVPTAYAILNGLEHHPVDRVSGLKFAISGGAPLAAEIKDRFEARFQTRLLEGYGLSEATCVSTMNPPQGPVKPGSVGVPLPGVKLEVRNEDGEVLAHDQVGELWVSGEHVMAGYWANPEATAAVLKDGWLRTMDLGYYDADGYFYLKGRRKDLIIRGGENIYPREVEEVLLRHPAIAECAVIGIADWVWGEEVMALVVLKSGSRLSSSELGEYCHREIADYKCPRLWKIVSELPKTATGEVARQKLHEKYRLDF